MNNILNLIGRTDRLFAEDLQTHKEELLQIVSSSRFLVLGGAGSIGQAVTKEIFKRKPQKLHVVDLSENNLVELVRDIRSSFGYISGDFQTFALDIGSEEYDAFFEADGGYDYILNLSALKHVRSEKDPYTLMRMINTNIFNTDKTMAQAIKKGVKKYFCVSTDKAANPVNMMGASKRIMEMFINKRSEEINVSMARFANVAFSDGSLLHGFNKRLEKKQPIVAPNDIKRYFVIPEESGELCLMSCIFGNNRDIFFPKLNENLHLIKFSDIAVRYLQEKKLNPHLCETEEEAREYANHLPQGNNWPCLFTESTTTGEKDFEEFFTEKETIDNHTYVNLGVIKQEADFDEKKIQTFLESIDRIKKTNPWTRSEFVKLFHYMIPGFGHKETGKFLDGKM